MVSQRKTFVTALTFTASVITLLFVSSVGAKSSARPFPPDIPETTKEVTATGYCISNGGSIQYESISNVILTPNTATTYKLEVQVFIANPTGCIAGQPCPEYDDSPEYVNVWIDWNGDKTWDNSEKVMDLALTGYSNINYSGTMTAVTQFSKPAFVTKDPTWLRANLGWGYDPNNPCEMNWIWGNVVDQPEQFKLPKIKDIKAKGIGTEGDNPQTGKPVQLEADLEVPANYEITKCEWSGDLTPSPTTGDVANKCQGNYTPATGDGPKIATYGKKTVKLTITYKHKTSGLTGQSSKKYQYKVFFDKGKPPPTGSWGDDDGDGEPNWFEYWGDDGAVPGLKAADVEYDASKGPGSYGSWSASDDKIHLGGAAAQVHYPNSITVPALSGTAGTCPGGTFGGAKGIDSVAEVLKHERYHEQIWDNWNGTGAIWVVGTTIDTDDPTPTNKMNLDADNLPDTYENTTSNTDPNNRDSCDLEHKKSSIYKYYGDQEFMAMQAGNGQTGVANKDWANPGKQVAVPFSVSDGTVPVVGFDERSGATHALPSSDEPVLPDFGELVGLHSDTGIDTDGDGLYNNLRLSVDVQIYEPSSYNLVAWLEDGLGTPIGWASTVATLDIGSHTVDLFFDGLVIQDSGLNGPYNIARVELRVGEDELLGDVINNAYTTAAYQYTEFESPIVSFTGDFSDTGIDTDSDGLYDLLRLNVNLDVQATGTYNVTGEFESSKDVITVVSKTASLSIGSQSVDLDFDGRLIFQHRQDGPYYLRRLRVEDTSGNKIDFINEAYTTGAYTYTQFQHDGVSIDANSYRDQGVDIDNDGDFDYLRVEFDLNVGQAGNYRVLADLNDSNGNTIASKELPVTLTMGNPFTVTLDFLGSNIYQLGIDGPYQVSRVTLINAEGMVIDYQQNAHTTLAYSYTDFGAPLVLLTGNYQDYGQDISNDGLYDYLVIEIGVLPDNDGLIVAMGRLVDSLGQEIELVTNHVEMTGGSEQKIALAFDGKRIRAHGIDGPYELRDLLVYQTIDPNQSAYVSLAHTTNAYNHEDFPEGLLVTFTDDSFTVTKDNGQVNLEWQTNTEPDNAGFFVWRGQLLLGKTECSRDPDNYVEVRRISTLLPAKGDKTSGYLYSYEDNQITFGNTYCYALEDVQQRGESNFHLEDIVSISIE